MNDPETLSVYAARAAEYDTLVQSDGPSADMQRFIDNVTPGGRVLDIGCGPGAAAGYMAAAGLRADAWDPVPEMLAMAAARPGVTARAAGYDDLTAAATYDGIWANFSMLHTPLSKWPAHVAAIKSALKPGGLFHLGTKLGTGETRDSIGRLYSYMDRDALRALLTDAGFALEFERTGEEAGLSGEVAPFIILLARA
ncbi:class I SAM-dependent methyltransferase [uncultured Tateyamaria sp.]|uniref:class I SAM-dependent methyltransferase n=1 Tax=Tateyamaria sp. 1078 TaxID=3417464 RepID=UPI00262A49D2|nr:class I SAM-dependent methyltransferase [uncultured Tateyamaria sp.]